MNTFNFKFRTLILALMGVLFLSIGNAYAGSVYSDGRAFLRPGSPTGAGKVYVGKSSTNTDMDTPAASSFKACNSSTSPAMTAQVKGAETTTYYHFFAMANAGYKFLGWYDPDDKPRVMTDASRNYYRGSVRSGTMALSGDLHAYLDCYACFIKCIQMSFVRPTNGSFTISNNGETVPDYQSFTVDGKVTLTASPADGYKLRGWYTTTDGVNKTYVAFGQVFEPLGYTSNVTIGAEFVPDDGKATFWIKGTNQLYGDLNQANTAAASSSSKMIVVVSDGNVGAGEYTISSGVTLLIPFKEEYNAMTTPRVINVSSSSAANKRTTTFRKLSLTAGAVINCEGNICVGGTLASVGGGNASSFPTGTVGMIDMSHGGTINLKQNSNLYCWGFVKGQDMDQGNNTTGCGQIIAENKSHVWEFFQVGDWRGGNNCLTIYNNSSSWRYFPFQAWTIQNVEVPVTYRAGAQNHCYWSIFGNGEINTINFVSISNVGGAGLFQIGSGSFIKKWYDPTTDRVCVELNGASKLDAITLNVLGQTVSSNDYNLPIPANVRIILANGASSEISKPIIAHAGSVIDVQEGGKLTISGTLYLFDKDEWDTYCMGKYFCTYESPSIHYNRGDGSSNATLEDATIIADGAVVVTGNLYATKGGANIMGNHDGTVQYTKLPGNTNMTQCREYVKNVSVAVRSANLHNENGTHTKSSVAIFKNVHGRWFVSAKASPKSNKTYDFTYIKSGDMYGTAGTNTTVSSCYSKDKTGLEVCDKWANIRAEGCDDWWEGIDDGNLYNYTLYNTWHQFIKTSMTLGDEEDPIDVYSGTDGKLYAKEYCDISEFVDINADCRYTFDTEQKALVGKDFISVEKNSNDEAYHKVGAASTYYLCFPGCIWKPATKVAEKEKAYTVESVDYIWYNGAWLPVTMDSSVSLYYSLDSSNVKVYYEYVDGAWVLASPVAEVVTSAATEQVYSMAAAIEKATKSSETNVTIRLLKDASAAFTYEGTNNCGLDLNGFTYSSTSNGFIKVNHASAKVILKDQSASGNGKILMSYNANAVRYPVVVAKGSFIVNSGTISVTNNHASAGAGAIDVKSGAGFAMHGGNVSVTSKGETWGVYTESSTTSNVLINGGTLEVSTTSTSATPVAINSLGGLVTISAGETNATTTTSTSAIGVKLGENNSRLAMTGGTLNATAKNNAYGVCGVSGKTTANASISGGTINATTSVGAAAEAVRSFGVTAISGGTLNATSAADGAYGVDVQSGTTTVTGGVINATATTTAYGIYNQATLNANGGTVNATTTASTLAYGLYAAAGTATVEDGEFHATTKTTDAYAIFVPNTTAVCTVNGGKFMVKTADGESTDGAHIYNTAASTNLQLGGGYYNLVPAAYIKSGKEVKELNPSVESALIAAGYIRKIAGTEHTVTWHTRLPNGDWNPETVVQILEDGSPAVYPNGTPAGYDNGTRTTVFAGWATTSSGSIIDPLPAVTADVEYFAQYSPVYAEVIANGSTTRYNSVSGAWTAAMACKQATIRVLSSVVNVTQLDFNPSNAGAIITLDLNGRRWAMTTAQTDRTKLTIPFLWVRKAGCKLIITDNSASGDGSLESNWDADENLWCVKVDNGELVLQNGVIRCENTKTGRNAIGVRVVGGTFTMLGGTIEASKSVSGGAASGVYAHATTNLSGGTILAHHAQQSAIGVYTFNGASGVTTIDEGFHIDVDGVSSCHGVCGSGTAYINGGNIHVHASSSEAYGFSPFIDSGNKGVFHITGNPTVNIETLQTAAAFYVNGDGVEAIIDGGTYTVQAGVLPAEADDVDSYMAYAFGIFNKTSGAVTVNGGTWDVTADGSLGSIVRAETGSATTINDGTFTMKTGVVDLPNKRNTRFGNIAAIRTGGTAGGTGTTVNVYGGTYTITNNSKSPAEAYFVQSVTGTTTIKGSPVVTAAKGFIAGADGYETCTANISIDGGTYHCTDYAFRSITTVKSSNTITGQITVEDGKFMSTAGAPIYTDTPTDHLTIHGGWYNDYSMTKATLNTYVETPSEAVDVTSGPEYDEGYRYHVLAKYNVTWSIGGNSTVQEYLRNEIPVYAGTPTIDDGNYYEFTGWQQWGGDFYEVGQALPAVTASVTYTAVFRKIEAEVIEGDPLDEHGDPKQGIKFELFSTAFDYAKNLPIATIRLLSSVDLAGQVWLSDASGSLPLTIDLNGHLLQYAGNPTNMFVVIAQAGCTLRLVDSNPTATSMLKIDVAYSGGDVNGVLVSAGNFELESGKIYVRNRAEGKGAYGVAVSNKCNFTMTGGTLEVTSKTGTRAINNAGTCELTGGTIDVSADGSTAYAAFLYGTSTLDMSGETEITSRANSSACGVWATTATSTINIRGGSIDAQSVGSTARPVLANNGGHINIYDCTVTANGGGGNIETVSCHNGGVIHIYGGEYNSTSGSPAVGVQVFTGEVTIGGSPVFKTKRGINVGTLAQGANVTATALVTGGTFDCSEYVFLAKNTTDGDKSVTGFISVNGGLFKAGTLICDEASMTECLRLNGGKYHETSGTDQKDNMTPFIRTGTTIHDISETIGETTYHYQLSTLFTVTWVAGAYSKNEQIECGITPSNDEVTSFVRNDSVFYFTGWSPELSPVVGDITYTAVGNYYEAKVKAGNEEEQFFEHFGDAWAYAMDKTSATITLLNSFTLTETTVYQPSVAGAQHILDLNNYTLSENTEEKMLVLNRADAKLTITDTSGEGGGQLRKYMSRAGSTYGIAVYSGELVIEGGTVYNENTIDDINWYPTMGLSSNHNDNAKITITGGTVQAVSAAASYTIAASGPVTVTGGHLLAIATKDNARAILQQGKVANISGGTIEARTPGTAHNAYAIYAYAWIGSTPASAQNGTINVTNGTFIATGGSQDLYGAFAGAFIKKIGDNIVTAHGTINIDGGNFTISCSAVDASRLYGAGCFFATIFDDETPHHMLGESQGEMNIRGGSFLIDTRDGDTYNGAGNVEMLRSWGNLHVSGGTFTVHTKNGGAALGVFRNKTVISGNPVFNINCNTMPYGIRATTWNEASYCDADVANNLAEVEVNGGTFTINDLVGEYAYGIWASGQKTDGYSMRSKITVNGGEFITIQPAAVSRAIAIKQAADIDDATAEVYIHGGKFKSLIGTLASNTPTGTNIEASPKVTSLSHGYFVNDKQLLTNMDDTCRLITLKEGDDEYANGYRYLVEPDNRVTVTVGLTERGFLNLNDAFEYAKGQIDPLITLVGEADFTGNYILTPTVSNWNGVLDLNNHVVTSTLASFNRFFTMSKADAKLTITDNSGGTNGAWNMALASAQAVNGIVIDHGEIELAGGKLNVTNTAGGVNVYGTDGTFTQSGGALALTTTGSASGVVMRGAATVTGGTITVSTTGSPAQAFFLESVDPNPGLLTISGSPTITVSAATNAYGVYTSAAGRSITVSGGDFTITSAGAIAYGVGIEGGSEATVSGGKFTVQTTGAHARGIHVKHADAEVTVTGGEFDVKTTVSEGVFDNIEGARNQGGTLTISGGKFTVADNSTRSSYGIRPLSGTTTVSGTVKVKADKCVLYAEGTFQVTGGYYSNTETSLGTYCVAPKRALLMTQAEKEAIGLDYNYKVVTAYELAWVTDGDPLTGDYTPNGYVEAGIALTAPNTPTKTGYDFAGWHNGTSVVVPSTMPSNDVTYTAQWTPKTNTPYVVNHCQQNILNDDFTIFETENLTGTTATSVTPATRVYEGFTAPATQTATILADGSLVINYNYTRNTYSLTWDANGGELSGDYTSGTVKYGTTIVAPTISRYGYKFLGWNVVDGTAAATMPASNLSYTALWSQYKVKVKVGSDETFYFDLNEALDYAKDLTTPLITLIAETDFTGNYILTPTVSNWNGVLDLNNHVITSTMATSNRFFTMSKADAKLTITDNSGGTDGAWNMALASVQAANGIVIDHGEVELAGGKLNVTNTAGGVNVCGTDGTFTQSGGALALTTTGSASGVVMRGAATVTGGTITVSTTGSPAQAFFLESVSPNPGLLTISGTPTITVSAATKAYGVYTSAAGRNITISGGDFTITSAGIIAYGVGIEGGSEATVSGGKFTVQTTGAHARGIHVKHADAEVTVTGGEFDVKTTVSEGAFDNVEGARNEGGTLHISGGKFTVADNSTRSSYGIRPLSGTTTVSGTVKVKADKCVSYSAGTFQVTGGYYSNTETSLGTYCVAPKRALLMTQAEKEAIGLDYNYKVVTAYELAWVTDGDPLTGDYTPNGYVEAGSTLTAPNTPTKTGYDFAGWHNGTAVVVPSTMPSNDVTYTAQWTPKVYSVTLHTNGGTINSGNITSYTYGVGATLPTDVTLTAHEFLGWFDNEGLSGSAVTAISTSETGAKEYWASWSPYKVRVTAGSYTAYYHNLNEALEDAKAQASPTITLLGTTAFTGPYMLTPTVANWQGVLDLNNCVINSTATSGNRFFTFSKAGAKLTITDNSGGTDGVWNFPATVAGGFSGMVVDNGEVVLAGGKIHAEHTQSSQLINGVYVWGGKFTQTNGIIEVQNANNGAANGVVTKGTSVISGGEVTVTTTGTAESRALSMDTGGSLTVSGGKFNGGTHVVAFVTAGTITITGGYFANKNTNLDGLVHLPYQVVATTDADKQAVGSAYNWKVILLEDIGFYADIVDWTSSTLTINASGWTAGGWPYTVNGTSYAQTGDRTLTISYGKEPGEEILISISNKDGEIVSQHTYVVPFVNPATLTSNPLADVYVHGTTLTIDANVAVHNVYVGVDATIEIGTGKTLTANALFLRTDVAHAAELDNKGTIAAQVFYTRIVSDNSAYYQFGLPWNMSDAVPVNDIRLANGKDPVYGGTWLLRRYNEETRAENGKGNNWVTVAKNDPIVGGVGYEMISTLKYYREFLFPVTVPSPLPTSVPVSHTDGAAGVTECGWNVLVSPLTSSYHTRQYPEAPVICWMKPYGFEQDIPEVIPPSRVFAYQAASSGSLYFDDSQNAFAPRRIKAEDEEVRIQWVQLDIQDAKGEGDQTSVYSHPERYDDTYQTGIDVAKQMLTGPHAILYSMHTYGTMAFAGVADEVLKQGVPLTVYSPSAQELTISMRDNDWLNRLEAVYLIDNETGLRTDLLTQDYTFDTEEGTTEGRFILYGVFKAPQGTTDIEPTSDSSLKGREVEKLVIHDKLYIRVNGTLYDATGKQVNK